MLFVVDFCRKFCTLPPCWFLIFGHTLATVCKCDAVAGWWFTVLTCTCIS